MWDVRSGSSDPVAEVAVHAGPKATRHVHIPALSPNAASQILTTGFSRTRDREYSLFDIRSLSSGPTKTQRIDTGTGIITPLVDESRGIVYLAGKGDMTLRWVEVGGPGGVTEGEYAATFLRDSVLTLRMWRRLRRTPYPAPVRRTRAAQHARADEGRDQPPHCSRRRRERCGRPCLNHGAAKAVPRLSQRLVPSRQRARCVRIRSLHATGVG